MSSKGKIDLSLAFKKLVSQTGSQESRLRDYEKIINSRDQEIEMLQSLLADSRAYRSSVDNEMHELEDLRQYINDLQQQVSGSVHLVNGNMQLRIPETVSSEEQLRSLRKEYTYLQTQLADLQMELQEANSRNLLLQQQTSRVSELESLLANAEQEALSWKDKAQQNNAARKGF